MRCQFCVDAHSQRAIAQGASKKEVAESISVAMLLAGGTQIGWANVYSENVYGLIFEEKKSEEQGKEKGFCNGMLLLNKMLPDTFEAFGKLRDSIFESGELDRKTKELIAIASSVLMRCQFCVDAHSQKALIMGASKKEIAEAIAVAMFIAAGSQLGWTNIYSENVYGLIFEEKKSEVLGTEKGCCCGK
jgi:AhpD family alkylhydroperoxidase